MSLPNRHPGGAPLSAGGRYAPKGLDAPDFALPREDEDEYDDGPYAVTATTVGPSDYLLAGVAVPARNFPRGVIHVGSMRAEQKKTLSYEGAGMSVSVHPGEWERIAKLGGGDWWHLTRTGNAFLEYRDLTEQQKDAITDWGVARGYVERATAFEVSWWDEEDDRKFALIFTTEPEAQAELEGREDLDGTMSERATVRTTEAFPDPTVRAGSINEHEILTTLWAEQETTMDGVWWDDTFDLAARSCPRGVVLADRLQPWSRRPAR